MTGRTNYVFFGFEKDQIDMIFICNDSFVNGTLVIHSYYFIRSFMTETEARFSAYPGEARNQIEVFSKDNQTQNRINENRLYYSISSYLI